MSWLLDPRVFNYTLIVLHALSAARWAYERRWWDCAYWLGCLWITLAVTYK